MNVFAEIRDLVLDCLTKMQNVGDLPAGLDFTNITVEPSRDKLHGDMATNAALVLGKACGQNPRELADKLATRLRDDGRIDNIDIAGPGFLNLNLNIRVWHKLMISIMNDRTKFGNSKKGKGKKVNVEYVSANPTGPLHVGHARGAIFGDALANLLKFSGYKVTREYYVNDGGAQVDVLARSVYLHYEEANKVDMRFVEDGKIFSLKETFAREGMYPGDYLEDVGKALAKKYGSKFSGGLSDEGLLIFRDFAIVEMMKLIKSDLRLLGINMDNFFSEKSLYETDKIDFAVDVLKEKGLIYQGTLPPPKGKQLEDWEARKQTLFKSTYYGDDVDRPIKKHDGSWTYFTPDIAYHYDKIDRGYDRLINVFGADHGGYVKRMKAAVSALSDDKVDFDIKTVNLVKLLKNGEPYKMSKRADNFIGLRDLLKKVDVGVVRFVMLTRKNDAELDFDVEKVLEQSKENSVYYVQYAYARVQSVLRKIGPTIILNLMFENHPFNKSINLKGKKISQVKMVLNMIFSTLDYEDFSILEHKNELALIKKMAEWPRLVELAAEHNEPHRIAFYLTELAATFHSFWNSGKDNSDLSIIHAKDINHMLVRLALLSAVEITLSCGLKILGVKRMGKL